MMSPTTHSLREETISTKVEMQPATSSELLRRLQEDSVGKGILNEEPPAGAFLLVPMLYQPSSALL
jgi:hypothetical protein